ncbi:MAG: hypothetical protein ACKO4N_07300 [Verrucomicrobiota bacterium]
MKSIFTVTCIFLKSAGQDVFLRSALTALLLAPLAAHSARPAYHSIMMCALAQPGEVS